MTIAQALSAPLVVVVGATGNQGGSVVKALEESDKPYRIRIFTRDATKPAAQALLKKGIEVVAISLVVENAKKVNEAFVGANMAFVRLISRAATKKSHPNSAHDELLGASRYAKSEFCI
jgi:uncharacterized protein YbjT (DUF2867 family)